MPRIRSVHPDLCMSETMADVPARVERTFVRLWTHCDDHGRCHDNVRLIKAAIYPLLDKMTFDELQRDLVDLEERCLIWRYEVDGVKVLQVRSWSEFQHPQRPSKSRLPEPPVHVREASAKPLTHSEPVDNTFPRGLAARSGVEREIGEGGIRSIVPRCDCGQPLLAELQACPWCETPYAPVYEVLGGILPELPASEAS